MTPNALVISRPHAANGHADSIDDLDRAIVNLAGRINAATYDLLVLVRRFDERAGWLGWGFRSCAEWLHWRCDIGLSAAREKVRVAHALKTLPAIGSAFANGELSYSKVRPLTRVANANNEDELLAFARRTTAARVEERCCIQRGSRTRRGELVRTARGCPGHAGERKRFLDAHHVEHWAKGGETSLANLLLLCSSHHTLVHEGGFRIEKDYQDRWFFKRPDGRAVPTCGYQPEDMMDDDTRQPPNMSMTIPQRGVSPPCPPQEPARGRSMPGESLSQRL